MTSAEGAIVDQPAAVKTPLLALVGNPNTGKTTVFNALCGARQKVGNYPGVTVEKKMGVATIGGTAVDVVDLPGLYSLNPLSPDELVATRAILAHVNGLPEPDVLVFVLDATNLKRNLYLYSQLAETGRPIVVVATMTDLMEAEGVHVDFDKLANDLDVPVVSLTANTPNALDRVKATLEQALASPPVPKLDLAFDATTQQALDQLQRDFPKISRFEASALLFQSQQVHNASDAIAEATVAAVDHAQTILEAGSELSPAALASFRYQWAERVVQAVETRQGIAQTFSRKLDRVLTHRVFGLLIFAAVMFLVFQSIYTWAVPFMDLIDWGIAALSSSVSGLLVNYPLWQSIVVDGMIAGVGSVVVFVPQIVILFMFVTILEDSGYLARAAFLMDKLLSWTGLNGRAFIPMLSSFACAVPGIMAARVMPDPKARMATILVAPLMSCSARLPIYILMISAFIEPRFGPAWAAVALFGMHAVGLVVALPIAWVLNRGILKTPEMPFILELPSYRIPKWFNVFFRSYEAGKKFVLRAGTVIFAFSIVIWALSYFPRPQQLETTLRDSHKHMTAEELDHEIAAAYLEQSYLGRAGKSIQPVFAPLGFDWKITVGILGAFPAREVILSTLGIIYQIGEADEESDDLKSRMIAEQWPDGRTVFTPLVAVVLMIFFALCSQCMSTLITVQRELNSWKWAAFLFVYMTTLAYLAALGVYQGGVALGWG